MARKDMADRGAKLRLAGMLSERTGRPISYQTLIMALSGFRATAAYLQILTELKAMLEDEGTKPGEDIHVTEKLQ